MIYRHYKGGLYYKLGYASRLSKEFPATTIELMFYANYSEAKTPKEKRLIPVFSVTDKLVGSTYLAYETNVISGLQTLYKDLDDNYWLRPMDMFNDKLSDDETYRFELVKGEELFDYIKEMRDYIPLT